MSMVEVEVEVAIEKLITDCLGSAIPVSCIPKAAYQRRHGKSSDKESALEVQLF